MKCLIEPLEGLWKSHGCVQQVLPRFSRTHGAHFFFGLFGIKNTRNEGLLRLFSLLFIHDYKNSVPAILSRAAE